MLRPDELNRSSRERVTAIRARFVLGNPLGQVFAGRAADVERRICTSEHVDEGAHLHLIPHGRILRGLRCALAPQDDGLRSAEKDNYSVTLAPDAFTTSPQRTISASTNFFSSSSDGLSIGRS